MNYVIRIIGIIACFLEIILFLVPVLLFNKKGIKKAKKQTVIMTVIGIICGIVAILCLIYNIILEIDNCYCNFNI